MQLTTRNRNMISGLIALVLLFSAIIVGVEGSFGAFDDTYRVNAVFDSAGQGLQHGSDVKIRGVNVGKVDKIELQGLHALVSMDIDRGERIPKTASMTVRPKTLFGEKFVDVTPGADETSSNPGDFYPHSGTVTFTGATTGGFELEKVLDEVYPLFKDISPSDIMTVLNTLADAGQGLGPAINRQLANGQKIADVFAAHDADQRQFLADLDTVAAQLGMRSDDLVALAKSLNSALPTLNSRSDELNQLLVQTARLSNDVSDLLENNTDFIDRSFHEGQAVLDTLDAQRAQLIPLVSALASYTQWLTEIIRIPLGDGTYMAAVRGLLGTQSCLLGLCNPSGTTSATTSSPAAADSTAGGGQAAAGTMPGASTPQAGTDTVLQALLNYLGSLGGQR